MSFSHVYFRALVAQFVAECGATIETGLALDPRHEADPGSRAIRETILALLADLRAGDEARAFRPDNLARALGALHAHSIEAIGLGGAQGAEFTVALSPVGHAATEMLVEIAKLLDAKRGSVVVPEFRRRQRRHREALQSAALEIEGRALGGATWRARVA